MALHRNAKEPGTPFVLADRQQSAAKRRTQDKPHQRGGDGQKEVVELELVMLDIENERTYCDRLAVEIAQPVEATGKIVPAIGEVVPQLAERDGAHREIDAAPARDQKAEQRAGHAAE